MPAPAHIAGLQSDARQIRAIAAQLDRLAMNTTSRRIASDARLAADDLRRLAGDADRLARLDDGLPYARGTAPRSVSPATAAGYRPSAA